MNSADLIRGRDFYPRLVRKLVRPGVLSALIRLQRLDDQSNDSFGAVLARRAAESPDSTGLLFENESYTWADINKRSNAIAHVLADRGIGKGHVVVVHVTNRPAFLFAAMGIIKLGAIAALVNTTLRGEPLAHSYRVAGAKAVIVGEELTAQLAALPDGCDNPALPPTKFWVGDLGEQGCPAGFLDLELVTAEAPTTDPQQTSSVILGDPAFYVFTSGTTGLPKAAVNAHRKLFMGGLFAGKALRELSVDDVVYSPLPLYHVTGLLGGWGACVFSGATFAFARSFSASRFWDDVRRFDATGISYMGELARYLWNQPPSDRDRDHRVTNMMGAGLRHDLWDPFKERFGIQRVCEVYGGSETPSGFVNLFNFDRTCGWSPRGWKIVEWDAEAEAIVRGRNGFAKPLGPGGTGLLLLAVHEHQRFDGYTDEAASAKKLLHDVFCEGDTWFDSGDLMLNQGHGHARFVDRLGDTFRWHAENVATTEVELALTSWPQVQEAVVYGVEVPGHEGRAGMAQLFVDDGVDLDGAKLAEHLRAALPKYAVPRFFRITRGSADVTGTFKHRKGDLKAEGYAPGNDEVLMLAPDESAPVLLTDELRHQIAAGALRL